MQKSLGERKWNSMTRSGLTTARRSVGGKKVQRNDELGRHEEAKRLDLPKLLRNGTSSYAK